MNAVSVYVNAAKLVMQSAENFNPATQLPNCTIVQDLCRMLSNLRQMLACVVCCKLLNDPHMPRNGRCGHNVCRLCVQGKKILHPPCTHCKDHHDLKAYDENKQMRCLLLCYKSMCEQIRTSLLYSQVASRKVTKSEEFVTVNSSSVGQSSVQDLINEGLAYEDILSAFNNDSLKIDVDTSLNAKNTPQTTPVIVDEPTEHLIPNSSSLNQSNSTHNKTVTTPAVHSDIATLQDGSSQSDAESNADIKRELLTPPPPPTLSSNPSQNLAQLKSQLQKQQNLNGQISGTQLASTAQNSQPLRNSLTVSMTVPLQPLSTTITTTSATVSQHHPTAVVHLNQLKTASNANITYLGANARGIVVPIVSSSATTTAPLTIASARLQSLNRQLAQARAMSVTSAGNAVGSTSAALIAMTKSPELVAAETARSSATNTTTTTATTSLASLSSEVKTSLSQSAFKTSPVLRSLTIASTNKSLQSSTNAAHSPVSCGESSSQGPVSISSIQTVHHTPPIKTVSHGSAMYSVLYTGIGNKITIKRKTNGDGDGQQKKSCSTTTATVTISQKSAAPVVTQAASKNTGGASKRRGCRCGNATPTPGKLTCCGQRCPCYVDSKSCIGCKCRGCRNPHRPGGGKVRPVIPELACYEIQMADEQQDTSVAAKSSSNKVPLTTKISNVTGASVTSSNHTQQVKSGAATVAVKTASSGNAPLSTVNVANATLIPLRGFQQRIATTTPVSTIMTNGSNRVGPLSNPLTIQTNTSDVASNNTGILQLDQLPTESVLIQNIDGKYQVVNLFTTSKTQNNSGTAMLLPAGIQRLTHSTPSSSSPNSNANNNSVNTSSSTINTAAVTGSTTVLPHIIIQPQPQQLLHSASGRPGTPMAANQGGCLTTSIPSLHQQLKQNFITVHAIAPTSNSNATTSPGSAALLTPAPSPAGSLTLTPLSLASNQYSQNVARQGQHCLYTTSTADLLQNKSNSNLLNSGVSLNHQTLTQVIATSAMASRSQLPVSGTAISSPTTAPAASIHHSSQSSLLEYLETSAKM